MSKPELKPCPFCGSFMVELENRQIMGEHVDCLNCGVEGPIADCEKDAFDFWNTRAGEEG